MYMLFWKEAAFKGNTISQNIFHSSSNIRFPPSLIGIIFLNLNPCNKILSLCCIRLNSFLGNSKSEFKLEILDRKQFWKHTNLQFISSHTTFQYPRRRDHTESRDTYHYRGGGSGCAGCAIEHPIFGLIAIFISFQRKKEFWKSVENWPR